jgi:hypothetical protein
MKRFGIFRRLVDGRRIFVGVDEDESSAQTEAVILKEQTGWDHVVFNLKNKRKCFDTSLYDRNLRKWNAMRGRRTSRSRTTIE